MAKKPLKIYFSVDKNAKPMTNDILARTLFGKSLKDLASEIAENKNGKYDALYSSP